MPESRTFRAVLTESGSHRWAVTVPELGQAPIDDPALAEFEARQLIQRHLGMGLRDADDLDITLVDDQGQPVFVFDLLFTSYPGERPAASDPAYRRLMDDPPPGCRYEAFGSVPGLRCVRRGTSMFQAVASSIAYVRQHYGLEADDLDPVDAFGEPHGGGQWTRRADRRRAQAAAVALVRWCSVNRVTAGGPLLRPGGRWIEEPRGTCSGKVTCLDPVPRRAAPTPQ